MQNRDSSEKSIFCQWKSFLFLCARQNRISLMRFLYDTSVPFSKMRQLIFTLQNLHFIVEKDSFTPFPVNSLSWRRVAVKNGSFCSHKQSIDLDSRLFFSWPAAIFFIRYARFEFLEGSLHFLTRYPQDLTDFIYRITIFLIFLWNHYNLPLSISGVFSTSYPYT